MTEHWPHHSTQQHILYILKLEEQLLNDPLTPAVNGLVVSHTVTTLTWWREWPTDSRRQWPWSKSHCDQTYIWREWPPDSSTGWPWSKSHGDPKLTWWRKWPPDSSSQWPWSKSHCDQTYIWREWTLYSCNLGESHTMTQNLHDEEDDPQTPAVNGLGVGPTACCDQNFRGQVSGRATKCLHHGARIHKLGQAEVCHL